MKLRQIAVIFLLLLPLRVMAGDFTERLRVCPDAGQPVLFGQIGVSPGFSQAGAMHGAAIEDVAARLRSGELQPENLPVHFIWVDCQKVAVNNRSLTAAVMAGIKPVEQDVSGQIPKEGPDGISDVMQRLSEINGKPRRCIRVRESTDRQAKIKALVCLEKGPSAGKPGLPRIRAVNRPLS